MTAEQISRATAEAVMVGTHLTDLSIDQSEWSQRTFGTDAERGPIGALKHLALEAVEAQEAASAVAATLKMGSKPVATRQQFREELADCLLLLLDANRRAGFTLLDLVDAGIAKMDVNRNRTFVKVADGEPSMHVKTELGGEG